MTDNGMGENWQELRELVAAEARNALQKLGPGDADTALAMDAVRADLPEDSAFVIERLVSLGWRHCLVWLTDEANRERLAAFVSRTEDTWLAWWIEGFPSSPPDRLPPGDGQE